MVVQCLEVQWGRALDKWPGLSTGPQAMACSQNNAMMLWCGCVKTSSCIRQSVQQTSWPLPILEPIPPHSWAPRGWGGDYCGRYYLVIKRKTNRKKCAFFFLLVTSKCFWLPNVYLPHSRFRYSLSLFLAPGAVELSQQHQLCGERLLLKLVTRSPRKLWKNCAI